MSADSGSLGIKACIPGALECQGEGSLSPPPLSSTGAPSDGNPPSVAEIGMCGVLELMHVTFGW